MTTIPSGLGDWYHRIDLGNGIITPGDRDQSLTFDLYEPLLPPLKGLRVLDIGANACGLSLEFARRGASVVAIERSPTYIKQANFVVKELQLNRQIEICQCDIFDAIDLGDFDIISYVGLSYHLRYPQLALDMLSNICKVSLLTSTQTIPGDTYEMRNRVVNFNHVNRQIGALHG